MKDRSKKESILLFCGLALLCVLAMISFGYYNRYLKQQFQLLENERRTASVLWQSQRIQTKLAQTEGALEAVSHMAETADFSPEEQWFQDYLKEMNVAGTYIIEYFPMEWLLRDDREKIILDYDETSFSSLIKGERVFSDIQYSQRLYGHFFAIVEPVRREGQTIGVMCCTIPAFELIQKPGETNTPLPDSQYIVDKNGYTFYSYGASNLDGINILDAISEKSRISPQIVEKIQTNIAAGNNIVLALDGMYDQYMVACTYLGYRDWVLIQFIKTGSMREISDGLMRNTAKLCMIFGILTIGAAIFICRSISTKNRRLQIEYEKQVSLATAFDTLLFEYDPSQDLLLLTPGEHSVYDIDTLRMKDCRRHTFRSVHPEDVPKIKYAMERLNTNSLELRVLGKNGTWIWCECQIQLLTIHNKAPYIVGRVININARKLRELQLLEEVSTDQLTGLFNRSAMQSAIEELLENHAAGFLFMCDMDNFKKINDTLGHSAGDELLCKVAELLNGCFDSQDFVGRQSGDEFVAYMKDTSDFKEAEKKAALILEQFVELSGRENITVSISIGISHFPTDADTFEKLYITADTAMYEAKNMGKNRFCFYHDMNLEKNRYHT